MNLKKGIALFLWFGMMVQAIVMTLPAHTNGQSDSLVYVVPVEQTIEKGLFQFIKRAFQEAEAAGADEIILRMNTPGGEVEAADQIGALVKNSTVPVTAFVVNEAFSAGTYISLNADYIVMAPGSAVGSAAPIDMAGNMADQKTVAAWKKKMMSAAELNDRNPRVAEAMVDPNVEIEGLVAKGELLALSAQEAFEQGYADHLAPDLDGVLSFLKHDGAEVVHVTLSTGEQIARWLNNPFVVTLLFTIGFAGIAAEFLLPGFGLPGIVGLSAFGLFFLGNFIAGYADALHIVLFVIGIILLLVEVFVPSFGIIGIAGIAAVLSSLLMVVRDTEQGMIALGIAFLVTVALSVILIKYFGKRGTWNRFILREEMKSEAGYVANDYARDLVGKTGVAITPLRPAGTAVIDEERYDVVSEGGFIEANANIKIVKIEGTRIIVRKI